MLAKSLENSHYWNVKIAPFKISISDSLGVKNIQIQIIESKREIDTVLDCSQVRNSVHLKI